MEETLNKAQQSMVTIACFAAQGRMPKLAEAIGAGLENGLTVAQIKEALSQLYAYVGFPRSLNALNTLQAVLKERQEKGTHDAEGRDADPLPAHFDALAQGTQVQTQLTGGKPFNYDFAPATDYYLKAHLFGDIFARNNLTFAERELVTLAALCGLKGVDAQLRAHVLGAQNMGLSQAEIRAIATALQANVGETEAHRARKAMATAWNETCDEQEPLGQTAFPKGEFNAAYAEYFTGNSYLASLLNAEGLSIHNVTFEPGCRNHWHIHHKRGQFLICTSGRGWYQAWGEAAKELKAGDIVYIPAEVKHWHGAARDSWFQHLAFSLPATDASNEWCEAVADEAYAQLP